MVIILWGITQYGTYASGLYFDGVFYNLASLTQAWYIIRWQDLNGNGIPDYPTEFTAVASRSSPSISVIAPSGMASHPATSVFSMDSFTASEIKPSPEKEKRRLEPNEGRGAMPPSSPPTRD